MHIIEKAEQLDYDAFNTEGLPNEGYTEALGRRTWDLKHGLAQHYGCGACQPTFEMLESAEHDVVNIHLKKGVFDPGKFEEAVKLYEESREKWIKAGRPLHKDSPFRAHHTTRCPAGSHMIAGRCQ
jgi:hypothetical protein